MMTPEQRYMFDITGYLHLKNVLTDEHLHRCQKSIEQYISTPQEDLPSDFGTKNGKIFDHAFAFDKSLESLVFQSLTKFSDGLIYQPLIAFSFFLPLDFL